MAISDEITLKKLEVFLIFMRLGNLARTSELLGQSAVSVHRALHTLEEGLGCPLFRREGRNLIPLETAYVFAEHAKRAIDACEEGVSKVRDVAGFNAATLHIGSLYSLTLHCIPRIIVGLKLRKPALDIKLTMGSNRDLLRGLADTKLDAIMARPIAMLPLMASPITSTPRSTAKKGFRRFMAEERIAPRLCTEA